MATTSTTGKTGSSWQLPAPVLFVGSGIFQYTGAALAVGMFAVLAPSTVAWFRLVFGSIVLCLVWRPWREKWTWKNFVASSLFGIMIGLMNLLFYESISRIPLGVAVSIEFLGPVAVAVVRGRGMWPRIAALLALIGIISIGGLGIDLDDPQVVEGVLFVLGAAVMWAGYILLGQRIASRRSGVNSLSVGTLMAALVFAPFFVGPVLSEPVSWSMMVILAAVAVLSTTIPYSFEALALKRLSAPVFALLTALLPATSTVVGAIALQQVPTPGELIGLILVSVAVWLAGRS